MQKKKTVDRLARIGLIAKGMVYIVLGALAFMSAIDMGGASEKDANQSGVFKKVAEATGGTVLLVILIAGLTCYCIYRFVQTFTAGEDIKLLKRFRYFFSGIAYSSLTFSAVKVLLSDQRGNDQYQKGAATFLSKPYGTVIIITGAVVIACIGIYQGYYALSEKYKKHVDELKQTQRSSQVLLAFGKVGYLARGLVWLLIAFLLIKAAITQNASEAGNTSKAFELVEHGPFGSVCLTVIGLGLVTYGIFNWARAKWEGDTQGL